MKWVRLTSIIFFIFLGFVKIEESESNTGEGQIVENNIFLAFGSRTDGVVECVDPLDKVEASPGDIPPSASDIHASSTTSSRDGVDNISQTVEESSREPELSNSKVEEAQSAVEAVTILGEKVKLDQVKPSARRMNNFPHY